MIPTADDTSRPRFDAVIEVYDSTMITGVVYDHTRLTMDVQFQGGNIYRYRNVTPLEFTMLITSRSTGKTFNAVIKGKKKYTKLRRDSLV